MLFKECTAQSSTKPNAQIYVVPRVCVWCFCFIHLVQSCFQMFNTERHVPTQTQSPKLRRVVRLYQQHQQKLSSTSQQSDDANLIPKHSDTDTYYTIVDNTGVIADLVQYVISIGLQINLHYMSLWLLIFAFSFDSMEIANTRENLQTLLHSYTY